MLPVRPPKPKQLANQKALHIFVSCFLCIVLVAAIYSALRRAVIRYERCSGRSIRRTLCARLGSAASITKQAWQTTLLVGIYVVVNTVLIFTPAIYYAPNYFASRFGWLAAINMILCVFLGLKNTVLRYLLPTSYHKLYFFHQVVGYTALAQTLLHGIFYAIHFALKNKAWALINPGGNREGLYAGAGLLLILVGFWKQWRYAVFYFSHIAGFVIMTIFLGLHRPEWAQKLIMLVFFMGGIWCLDRLVRAATVAYNMINNEARLYPLAGGGVRLVFKKPLPGAASGVHCFVWVPGIRPLKTHPFTILSNSSSGLELVLKSYNGFTREAYKMAVAEPGRAMLASVHGPYGWLPDFATYDKIVVVSGGSGASFAFGLMRSLLDSTDHPSLLSIDFIWAVKTLDDLSWYTKELIDMMNSTANINFTLRITRSQPPKNAARVSRALDQASRSVTRHLKNNITIETTPLLDEIEQGDRNRYVDGGGDIWEAIKTRGNLKFEKLAVEEQIHESVRGLSDTQRVLVAACGPTSLIEAIESAAPVSEKLLGPNIDLFCEHFEW